MKRPFTCLAALLFALVALAHLARLWFHIPVVVGTTAIPFGVSIGGIVVPAILAILLWREAGAER